MSYRDNPAINFSTLKYMNDCPLAYKYRLGHSVKPTASMLKGSAFHCAVLQPDSFSRDYAAKSDKNAGDQATRIADKDYEDVLRMSDRFRVEVGPLTGTPEQAIYWRDEYTGLDCKGRLDMVTNGGFIELKTLSPSYANPDKFGRHCFRMQYDVQLAYYHDGLEYAGYVANPVTLIAVEQVAPYDVIVYDVPHYVIEDGRARYLKYLRDVKKCRERDEWPGRSKGGRLTLVLPNRFESTDEGEDWE